jgi:Ca-activated chloride channel family protein
VQKHANARVFAYGIGTAVNRFLIEGMAKAGRGESEIVTLNDKADEAAHRLYGRLRSPLLTDVSIDWQGLPVADVYPQRLPDLFSGKPLVVSGRYTAAARGTVRIRGKRAGEDFVREIPVSLSGSADEGRTLASFWARRKIDDLMSQDWAGLQNRNMKASLQKEITQLGIDYRLMTQFTSFVAVEERVVTQNGKPQRVEVPVEMPAGVSYETTFGADKDASQSSSNAGLMQFAQLSKAAKSRVSAGFGGGMGSGTGVVSLPIVAIPIGPPPPPPAAPTDVDGGAPSVEVKPTGERALLESKLHPTVLQDFDCWKQSGQNGKLVTDDTLELQLWLADASDPVIAQLTAVGFVLSQPRSHEKVLVGRLPVAKLADLVKINAVRFVSPVRR